MYGVESMLNLCCVSDVCLLGRSASADPGFLDRGSNFHRGGVGDLLTLPDSFSENSS